MSEVSCRAFGIVLKDFEVRGLDPSRLVEGTDCTVALLRKKHERISWAAYRVIMKNLGAMYSRDELIAMGGGFFRNPLMRPVASIGKLLFNLSTFYRWFLTDLESGGTNLWACVRAKYEPLTNDRVRFTLLNDEGFEPCPEFFLITLGAMRDMPRIFGATSATVSMELVDRGAVYLLDIPRFTGFLATLRKIVTWPFVALQAANELRDANKVLAERYLALQSKQLLLDQQTTLLRTVNEITRLIHAELEIDRTLSSITQAMVEVGNVARARIELRFASADGTLDRESDFGLQNPGHVVTRVDLIARNMTIGSLEIWSRDATAASEHDAELVRTLLPSICMALDESIAFTLLDRFRGTLEERVLQRTAELELAQQSLTRTVEDLEEAQKVRNRIFANINHEIRTPLSLIMLAAGEIRGRREHKSDPRTLTSVSHIESASERLLAMVDSMLLLAAGQEGKLKVKRRSCDIAIELRRTVSIWQPLATQHHLKLDYVGPARCEMYVDTAALERILANLLSNAIKYTPDNGIIEVKLVENEEDLVVSVRDTGIGLDEEFKKRIFGRFEQGRAAVRHGARSSGIGLSIVKELVEAHDGRIEVTSNQSGGTTFEITLPRIEALSADEQAQSGSVVSIHSLPAGFGLTPVEANQPTILAPDGVALGTVLVAEDDSGLRTFIGDLLLTQGYKVLLAADGFAALRLANENFPDMLVSDVGMPGMDGLELSRRFKEMPGNRLAPTLLLTAYGTVTDKMSGFGAGAVDYVTKPFEPTELIARVSSQLKIRDLALKLSQSEKLASLGTMSAGLAHEMRNPANGLLNALEPLRSLLPPELITEDTAVGQLFDVLRDCAEQLGRLSKQLLGFKGSGTMVTSEESAGHLVRRALTMVDPKAANVAVRTITDFDGSVRCAAAMMLQVLVNLIDNAIQAAGSGGTVQVNTRSEGGELIIDVVDSGPGVPLEIRERIFEPFFTTKAPGAGTGLGLSTSRQIVLQHQGTLRVLEGPRSTFRIQLPLNGPANVSVTPGVTHQRNRAAS